MGGDILHSAAARALTSLPTTTNVAPGEVHQPPLGGRGTCRNEGHALPWPPMEVL